MQQYKLNKVFDVDTIYRAETDKAYFIQAIGTNSTTKAVVKVAGAPVAEILDEIAPKEKINTNLLGPVNLGPVSIVVPPNKTFEFSGSSGSELRAIGKILVLEPGEVLPGDLVDRYKAQATHYITYIRGTYSHGTDVAWAADDENGVVDFTVPVKEKYTLNKFFGGTVANVSPSLAQKQFALRIYIEDKPYDIVETAMGKLGIEIFGCHLPPKEDVNFVPFTLEELPIVLEEGKNLKVKCINISGASISPTTGASLDVTVNMFAIKEIL